MGLFDKIQNAVSSAKDTVSDLAGQNQKPDDQIVMINDNDDYMIGAINQARATLPDFLKFCEDAPTNTRGLRVKAHFADEYGSEHIWLTDIEQEGNQISGIVSNTPEIVDCVTESEFVTVPMEKVSDWAFEVGGVQYGNYTVYAMFPHMDPDEVEGYVQGYGFTQNPLDTPNASFSELIKNMPAPGDEIEEDKENLPGIDEKLDEEHAKRMRELFAGEKPSEEERLMGARDIANRIYHELESGKYDAAAKRLQYKHEQAFLAHLGYSDADRAAGAVGEDEEIMGVTFWDYAAAGAKMQAGAAYEAVCAALGITTDEYLVVSEKWVERMNADTSYQMATQYSEYYAKANENSKVGHL